MFQKMLCRKSCHEISTKYRSGGGVGISEIANIDLFAGALKTQVLLFTTVKKMRTLGALVDLLQVQ